ncbi:hypothetical protein ACIRBZ_38250 [Streptomyces sp. NPDC094038]|uniref:hypothetical protein n=1 Tax=Streptomyces sp. NPDC094038 TaxID=3366055 RepID=UPI0037FDB8B7
MRHMWAGTSGFQWEPRTPVGPGTRVGELFLDGSRRNGHVISSFALGVVGAPVGPQTRRSPPWPTRPDPTRPA